MKFSVTDHKGQTRIFNINDNMAQYFTIIKDAVNDTNFDSNNKFEITLPERFALEDFGKLNELSNAKYKRFIIKEVITAYLLEFLGVSFSIEFSSNHTAHYKEINGHTGLYTNVQENSGPAPKLSSTSGMPIQEISGPQYIIRNNVLGPLTYGVYYHINPVFFLAFNCFNIIRSDYFELYMTNSLVSTEIINSIKEGIHGVGMHKIMDIISPLCSPEEYKYNCELAYIFYHYVNNFKVEK